MHILREMNAKIADKCLWPPTRNWKAKMHGTQAARTVFPHFEEKFSAFTLELNSRQKHHKNATTIYAKRMILSWSNKPKSRCGFLFEMDLFFFIYLFKIQIGMFDLNGIDNDGDELWWWWSWCEWQWRRSKDSATVIQHAEFWSFTMYCERSSRERDQEF